MPSETKSTSVQELFKILLSVILVYSAHYGTAKIYNNVCVPDGIEGYLQGLITTSSPWCKMALDIMKTTENHYSSVILVGLSRLLLSGVGI
jgi:hypothetical protein